MAVSFPRSPGGQVIFFCDREKHPSGTQFQGQEFRRSAIAMEYLRVYCAVVV